MDQRIIEIDDSKKDEIRVFDNTGANIIEKDFCLVMDNSPIVKHAVIDAPVRSPEHRIMLVKKGSVDYTLNYMDFHVSEGEVLMIPANYIIIMNGHSGDFNARVLSFRFTGMGESNLVGYEVIKLRLGYNEEQVFENFFQMMNQVLSSPTAGKRDFEHLVISMLFRIQGLNFAQNGFQAPAMGDRKQAIVSKFMQLLNANGPAPRSIAYYADKLGVSANYLSVVVKERSDHTVMEWVDIRTVTEIKMLLHDPSNLTVDQIAERLDFSSSSQMIRVFKKVTGVTPIEYRKTKSAGIGKKKPSNR